MQLKYTRIEIEPGRKPKAVTHEEGGDIGQGSTLLTVTNTKSYENAFRIRVQCDSPFWHDKWVKLRTVSPASSDTSGQLQRTQQDQYGAQDRWIRIFVPQKQQRDVQILFDLDKNSESRAGLYRLRILIEEEAIGSSGGDDARGRRTHTLSAQLLVLPFYRWSLETKPRQARLGWAKRTASQEVVVHNQGNDWLYCVLEMPDASTDPNALQIKNKLVTRVAVPPPSPADDSDAKGSERSVHLLVACRASSLRGAPVPVPLNLTATRLDAPTFPPWYDADTKELRLGAVTTKQTTEQSLLPPASGALYYPLIPAQITQAADGVGGFVRGLAATILGLLVTVHIGVFLFEQALHNNIRATVLNGHVKVGDWITVKGNYLPGSKILVKGDKDSGFAPIDTEIGKPAGNGKMQKDVGFVSFKADEALGGQNVEVRVQRVGVLPWLSGILPSSVARPHVTIDKGQTPSPSPSPMPTPTPTISPSGSPTPTPTLTPTPKVSGNPTPPTPTSEPTKDPSPGSSSGGSTQTPPPTPTPTLTPYPTPTTRLPLPGDTPAPTPRPTPYYTPSAFAEFYSNDQTLSATIDDTVVPSDARPALIIVRGRNRERQHVVSQFSWPSYKEYQSSPSKEEIETRLEHQVKKGSKGTADVKKWRLSEWTMDDVRNHGSFTQTMNTDKDSKEGGRTISPGSNDQQLVVVEVKLTNLSQSPRFWYAMRVDGGDAFFPYDDSVIVDKKNNKYPLIAQDGVIDEYSRMHFNRGQTRMVRWFFRFPQSVSLDKEFKEVHLTLLWADDTGKPKEVSPPERVQFIVRREAK